MTVQPLPPGRVRPWNIWPCGCDVATRAEVADHKCPSPISSALCVCGHERRQHSSGRGSCGVMASPSRLWDDCRRFRTAEPEPAPSAGQDTERLRDELKAWCQRTDHDWTGVDWDDPYGARIDTLLDGPLRQLIDQRDEARAQVQRVREVAADFDDGSEWGTITHPGHLVRSTILAALDGPGPA